MRGKDVCEARVLRRKERSDDLTRVILSAGAPAEGYLAAGFGTAGLPNLAASIGTLG
jgi:hypothetical protein